jgi:hypothetical protein
MKALVFLLENEINNNPHSRRAGEAREHLQALANSEDTEALKEARRIDKDPSFGGQDSDPAGKGLATELDEQGNPKILDR